MFRSFRLRRLLPFAVLALAGLLAGCYAYPGYPGYGYDGGYYGGYYGAPYYGSGVVAFGGGWGWGGGGWGWRGGGWRDHDWHGWHR